MTPDVVIVDIQDAWESVSNILGQVHKEDLLTEIFSRFCLGK
jgi:tRNA modification GTPase